MIYLPRIATTSGMPWFGWGWLPRPAAPRRVRPIVIAARRHDRRRDAEAALAGLAAGGEITDPRARQAAIGAMLSSVTAHPGGEDAARG